MKTGYVGRKQTAYELVFHVSGLKETSPRCGVTLSEVVEAFAYACCLYKQTEPSRTRWEPR